jgi:hypothetical protein
MEERNFMRRRGVMLDEEKGGGAEGGGDRGNPSRVAPREHPSCVHHLDDLGVGHLLTTPTHDCAAALAVGSGESRHTMSGEDDNLRCRVVEVPDSFNH